jgi:hypothetical protein
VNPIEMIPVMSAFAKPSCPDNGIKSNKRFSKNSLKQ